MRPRSRIDPSSSSSSDDEEASISHSQVEQQDYRALELAAALQRRHDFSSAAAELAAILRCLFERKCSKAVQGLIVEDVGLAIVCCDG